MELAAREVAGVIGVPVGVEIADRLACGAPRFKRSAEEIAPWCLGMRRWRKLKVAVSDADEQEPLTYLRHAVVCRVDDAPCAAVTHLLGFAEDQFERLTVNLVRKSRDILENERL